jgi:hypothetical protein
MHSGGGAFDSRGDNPRLDHGLYRQHRGQCRFTCTASKPEGNRRHERAGTASGINNAVARVAGVLAIAILGIVMVKLFGYRLERDLSGLSLPPGVLEYVRSNSIKLAGLALPSQLDTHRVMHSSRWSTGTPGTPSRLLSWCCPNHPSALN